MSARHPDTAASNALLAEAATGAHAWLANASTPLRDALRPGAALRVPVTPETVHAIESVFRLAEDEGAKASLAPAQGLDARQQAFLDDFRLHYLNETVDSSDGPGSLPLDAASFADSLVGFARGLGRPPARRPVPAQLDSALLIGAYGGEHVGDAAILGGVLLGLHRDFGTTKARILSFRPEHTARLAQALDVPVEVSTAPYDYLTLYKSLVAADCLVFAGGPLMELPRMIVKHLWAARLAHRLDKPFLVRRIGVGPFTRRISEWTARQVLLHADSVSVRTAGAARHRVAAGIACDIERDPAFDYLETRQTLTRLTAEERRSADAVLEGTEGRVRVGINLRPLRHDRTKSGTSFSKQAEDAFYDALCEALPRFAEQSPKPVTYVFFPMNPIQLGKSDLEAAYRLHRALRDRVDLRVWEADPDVDGVLHMLRQLDATIAMRFHGCIFSLSQNLPTVGVDYYPGTGGKVEQLFQDLGRPDDGLRIDRVDATWVLGKLSRMLAP